MKDYFRHQKHPLKIGIFSLLFLLYVLNHILVITHLYSHNLDARFLKMLLKYQVFISIICNFHLLTFYEVFCLLNSLGSITGSMTVCNGVIPSQLVKKIDKIVLLNVSVKVVSFHNFFSFFHYFYDVFIIHSIVPESTSDINSKNFSLFVIFVLCENST